MRACDLGVALVIFHYLEPGLNEIGFDTRSGRLVVRRAEGRLAMDFPASPPEPCEPPRELLDGLHLRPQEVLKSCDFLAVFGTEDEVRSLAPICGCYKKCPVGVSSSRRRARASISCRDSCAAIRH